MTTSELDRQIQLLLAPSGDRQYRRIRGAALAWLMDHADIAYPRLLSIVDGPEPSVLAVQALSEFRRADSVPVLAKVLQTADDHVAIVAADVLADHPAPEALSALEEALGSSRDQVVASAADGLAQRSDQAACASLRAALAHPNPDVRDRVRAALAELGC